jgi:hypothetical protein
MRRQHIAQLFPPSSVVVAGLPSPTPERRVRATQRDLVRESLMRLPHRAEGRPRR